MSDLHIYGIEYLRLGKVIWYQQNASTQIARVARIPTRLKTHRFSSKLISTGVNDVVRQTMNKLSTMLFQVVTVEQCCNNMLTILFIVGRTSGVTGGCQGVQ
jgi:hypothetical protein